MKSSISRVACLGLAAFAVLAVVRLAWSDQPDAASARRAALPSPEQVEYLKMEREMFIHYGPAAFQGSQGGQPAMPADSIIPLKLDTDQWCQVAKFWGAGQIVFVAKHGDGFCWWQTDTSDYGIKETPYKDGKGDVVKELSESCKKYGLKLGLYLAPCDVHLQAGLGGVANDPARQSEITRLYRQQLTELLSRYGEVSEVWFDGSCKIDVSDILAKYTPKAMVFQGPQATLRWPGNEDGMVPYPAWQTVSREAAATGTSTNEQSDPNGEVWLPMECDTPLMDHYWFWNLGLDSTMKSVEKLMEIYEKSVGRGSTLLLNATPDYSGLIPVSHVRRCQEFGAEIDRQFGHPAAEYMNPLLETCEGGTKYIELSLAETIEVDRTILEEKIADGMRIRRYRIEGFSNGAWKTLVANGESVGNKRIDRFEKTAVSKLRVVFEDSVGEPEILRFAAFKVLD